MGMPLTKRKGLLGEVDHILASGLKAQFQNRDTIRHLANMSPTQN